MNAALRASHLLLLPVLFALFTQVVSAAEVRQALVMGVWSYDDPKFPSLPGIEQDITRMTAKLKEVGFEVTVVTNPSLGQAKKAVDDFGAQLLAEKGVGLFYFSGHGSENDGKNYLVPKGSTITTRNDLDDEALSVQRVLNRMEEAGTAVNIVFLDCCRNSLTKGSGDLAPMRATGTFIGYATASAKVANAADDGSPYTSALLKHLATPGLSITDMHTRVTREVKSATADSGDVQIPFQYSGLDSMFAFVPAGSALPSAPPAMIGDIPAPEPEGTLARVRLSRTAAVTFRHRAALGAASSAFQLPDRPEPYSDSDNFPSQSFVYFNQDPWKSQEVGDADRTQITFYEIPARFKTDKGAGGDDPYAVTAAKKQATVDVLDAIYEARSIALKNKTFVDHSLLAAGSDTEGNQPDSGIPNGFWWGGPDYAQDSVAPVYIESQDRSWRGIARFINSGQDITLTPSWQAVLLTKANQGKVVVEISIPCAEAEELKPFYVRFLAAGRDSASYPVGKEAYEFLGQRSRWENGSLGQLVRDGEQIARTLTAIQ